MTTPLLSVVYAEERFAVVDKPSGLLSCPGRDPSLFDSVQTRVPQQWPHAVGSILAHRLDQWTSGLILVALDVETHRRLRLQFEAQTVFKHYEAEVVGNVVGDSGTIALPFRLDVDRRPHQIYDPVHGKLGRTSWRVLSRDVKRGRTRVEFTPHTGRTHQLRLHASHAFGLGCAIAGDALYGDEQSAARLLLHACLLQFNHPHTGERLTFTSTTPF